MEDKFDMSSNQYGQILYETSRLLQPSNMFQRTVSFMIVGRGSSLI